MLQWANQQLARVSRAVGAGLCAVARLLGRILQPLLGSWQAPPWLRALGRVLARPLGWLQNHLLWAFPLVLLLGVAVWQRPALTAWWYGAQPDPVEPVVMKASVSAPEIFAPPAIGPAMRSAPETRVSYSSGSRRCAPFSVSARSVA